MSDIKLVTQNPKDRLLVEIEQCQSGVAIMINGYTPIFISDRGYLRFTPIANGKVEELKIDLESFRE